MIIQTDFIIIELQSYKTVCFRQNTSFRSKRKFKVKMKTEKPNTLIVFCQNRGYKKLPKNIPVENLGRDIKKRFHFRRLNIKLMPDSESGIPYLESIRKDSRE